MIVIGPGVCEWVGQRINVDYNPKHVGIGWLVDDQIVCGVLYEGFTQVSVMAHIACEGQITRKFLRTIFDYPFNQLGVEKIVAPIYQGNLKAIRLVEKFGMAEETRLTDIHPTGDLIFYTIQRDKCRWIRS